MEEKCRGRENNEYYEEVGIVTRVFISYRTAILGRVTVKRIYMEQGVVW